MVIRLDENAYGKNAINLSKVIRYPDRHEIRHISVNISLKGDFDTVHTHGDNTNVLPTDTMKNTVYALAKDQFTASIEEFGLCLVDHFLSNNPQVTEVKPVSQNMPGKECPSTEHHTPIPLSTVAPKNTKPSLPGTARTSSSPPV